MSVERLSLDSNILFYTIDADAGRLQARAREVVRQAARSHDCILSLQTLCELFHSTTRKGKLTFEQAAAHVEDWQTLFRSSPPRRQACGWRCEPSNGTVSPTGTRCSGQSPSSPGQRCC